MFMRIVSQALIVAALAAPAFGQNVLVNGDFESSPGSPPANGNNIGHSVAPWVLGSGQQENLVQVDGPGGFDYGSNGPESDASNIGQLQHYLDIADGDNEFFQSFTPSCSGQVRFGGSFSTRANSPGTATLTLRQGIGLAGPVVGVPHSVNLLGGKSKTDPWTPVTFTAPITAGTTYSFVVDMDNNMNFDNGFAIYLVNCPADTPPTADPCCPPWNSTFLQDMLVYQGSGGISAPFTLAFQPTAAFTSQIQAYIDYLHTLNPSLLQITIAFRLHDGGAGANPVTGAQIGTTHFLGWVANSAPVGTPNFFTNPPETMVVNRWYRIVTGIFLNNNQTFFPSRCADDHLDVRLQVQKSSFGRGTAVLQYRKANGETGEVTVR